MSDHIRGGVNAKPVLAIIFGFVLAGALHLAVFGVDSSVTSDDGAYEIAVRSVRSGADWSMDYVLADVDSEGLGARHFASRTEDGYRVYARRPAWVMSLVAADRVGGIPAQRLLLIAAGAGCVWAAAALARAVGAARSATVAAGLTALSPVLFNSLQFWAHAPAAALVSYVLWAHLRSLDRHRPAPPWLALGLVAAALAPALRTEGGIFILAIAVISASEAIWRRRWSIVVYAGLTAVCAIGGHVGSSLVATEVTGSQASGGGLVSRAGGGIGGRLEGTFITVLTDGTDQVLALLLVVTPIVLTTYAVLLLRRGDVRAAGVVVLVASAPWVVRTVLYRDELTGGLLGAWPVAALLLAEPFSRRTAQEKRVIAVLGLAFLGVLATQYDIGGGLNWGGRFLSSGLPALAALVATTLGRIESSHRRDGALLRVAVVVLAAVTTMASVVADATVRSNHDSAIARIEEHEPSVPVVTSSAALPRLAWRTYPDVGYVYVEAGDDAKRILSMLHDAGHDSVVAYGLSDHAYDVLTSEEAGTNARREPRLVPLEPPD